MRQSQPQSLNVSMDSGTGPAVVLVHGIASTWTTFSNLVPLLADGHRLIAVDLLGFGRSIAQHPVDFNLDDHADALARTLSGLDLGSGCVLVGHSLGALIAARYVATQPNPVTRMVLIGPPIYPAPGRLGSPTDRIAEAARLSAYRMLRAYKGATIDLAQRLERLSPMEGVIDLSDANWEAFERSLANAIETQSTIDDLPLIDLPVDIVFGSRDPFVLPAGIRLAQHYSNVTVHRVAGADHLIRERLARVAADLIDA